MGLTRKYTSVADAQIYGCNCSCKTETKSPGNPDPKNYKIMKSQQIENYLIVEIHYPDCTNFEGRKILIFANTTLIDLLNQALIDPHFFESKKYKSPMVRVEPTERGWKAAETFCLAMIEHDEGSK